MMFCAALRCFPRAGWTSGDTAGYWLSSVPVGVSVRRRLGHIPELPKCVGDSACRLLIYNAELPSGLTPSGANKKLRSKQLNRDQKFFDMYSLVIGALAAVALAILVLAMKLSDLTQGVYTRDVDEYQAAVTERIKPFGEVYLPGEELQSSAPTVETAAEPEPVAAALTGPQVYNTACNACHGNGIGGAPIVGDVATWAPRIAQGMDVLYGNAINGFQGSAGVMIAKGGRLDLSDKEVQDAVDYMVTESQ